MEDEILKPEGERKEEKEEKEEEGEEEKQYLPPMGKTHKLSYSRD